MKNKEWTCLKEFAYEKGVVGDKKSFRAHYASRTEILEVRNVGDKNKEATIQISLETIKTYYNGKQKSFLSSFSVPIEFVDDFIKAVMTVKK